MMSEGQDAPSAVAHAVPFCPNRDSRGQMPATEEGSRPRGTRGLYLAFSVVTVGGAALLVFSREDRGQSWAFLALGLLGMVQTRARASHDRSPLGRWKGPLLKVIPALLLTACAVYFVSSALDSHAKSPMEVFLRAIAAVACGAGLVCIFRWRHQQ